MLDLKNVGIMAAFAGIASAWSQIKSFFIRFKSIFIITANISDHELSEALQGYLKDNYRKSKFGSLTFSSTGAFINTLGKRARIAFIVPSEAMTFWDGWKPMFVSKSDSNDRGKVNGSNLSITFIRGTFDIKKLVLKSVDRINHINSDENKKDIRFKVIDFFGRYGNGRDDEPLNEKSAEVSSDISSLKNLELLGVELHEIGQEKLEDPFENLYYDKPVNDFIKELDRWIESKEWFEKRGLDWRMGALLKGLPGTGKSSFAKAVAQKYNLPIYRFDLISMSNEELNRYWNRALNNSPCICLFEDMDRLYDDKGEMINSDTMQSKGKLTTDAILNCISGVSDSNGVLTMVTANHPEKLPAALTRAGRLDIDLELGVLTKQGQITMANKILTGQDHLSKQSEIYQEVIKLVEENPNITGAAFQRICTKYSLDKYWGRL